MSHVGQGCNLSGAAVVLIGESFNEPLQGFVVQRKVL